ncbi:MAG: glycoside hydrolase family 1 protein [Patescibacteria group bacterium]|mgnify:FL=1
MKYEFPKNFYWGAATSAHQVEGNNFNDWSRWEKEKCIEESGMACDHYNHFREDFDIAQELGHNAHRFSIEWSRIETEEGKFEVESLRHYEHVVKALRERNIEPFVTLWHWTLPRWLADKGGIENNKFPEYFARYVEHVAKWFDDTDAGVTFWMIFNEPGYWFGNAFWTKKFPAPKTGIIPAVKTYRNLISAHKAAYAVLKKNNPACMVGVVEATGWIAPEPIRLIFHELRNFVFPRLVKGYFDFFGLNYYRRAHIFGRKIGDTSEIGWEIYPEGLYKLLKDAYRRFKKPIIITENGIADSTDAKRGKFISDHLAQVHGAIGDGVDIRGYLYWSLMDNFEWDSGFGPRFGLVEVNYETLERKIRPSAYEYAKIAKNNGF